MNLSPVCLIDASIYIFRFYFAMPERWYSVESDYPTEAVYGYTRFLLNLLKQHKPNYIAACFDESLGTGFRHELYPDYKANRALADEALAFQLNACQEITQLLGIATFASKVYEADDLLGSLYVQCNKQNAPIALLTRDKDLGQLLNRPQDYLWDCRTQSPATNAQDNVASPSNKMYAKDIENKFGVTPGQMVDYLALVGDAIDNIPGVPGIGAKTASALLQHFGSIENIFAKLHQVKSVPVRGAKTLAEKLEANIAQIAMAQQLATIIVDIPLIDNIDHIAHRSFDTHALVDFFVAMGWSKNTFKTLLTETPA